MKKIFLILWLIGSASVALAQEVYAVYSSILNYEYKNPPYEYLLVADSTSKEALKYIDQITLKSSVLSHPKWKTLLVSMNPKQLKSTGLRNNFVSKVEVQLRRPTQVISKDNFDWQLNTSIKKYSTLKHRGLINFSSVFFSSDGKRAICGIMLQELEGETYEVFFLEKQTQNRWKVLAKELTAVVSFD